MSDRQPQDTTRPEPTSGAHLRPAPQRSPEEPVPAYVATAGRVTIDQYLALRQVPEHRRAARRAFAGELRLATVDEFDRVFAGVKGRR